MILSISIVVPMLLTLLAWHYWAEIIDWSVNTVEDCFEVKSTLFRGERFPLWLDCKGRLACFLLDLDNYVLRFDKWRMMHRHHQKARIVMDGNPMKVIHQLYCIRWWRVPGFIFEFYCWQRRERSNRAARRYRARARG